MGFETFSIGKKKEVTPPPPQSPEELTVVLEESVDVSPELIKELMKSVPLITKNPFAIGKGEVVQPDILPRNIENHRTTMLATYQGRRVVVYVGVDGQLWYWISEDESIKRRQRGQFPYHGQHTIASTPTEVAEFLTKYCEPSWYRDTLLRYQRSRRVGGFSVPQKDNRGPGRPRSG